MTTLAQLIAKMEGFGIPGAVPTVRHNPGDLRHSPHSEHAPSKPNDIGWIDSDEHGWEDLERQLKLYADRGMTLRQCIEQYAPPNENATGHYLAFVCDGLGCAADTPMSAALEIKGNGSL